MALAEDPDISNEDRLFGDLVVSQGLCTSQRVQECLAFIRNLAAAQVTPRPTLGELLARRGYLSSSQMDQTLRAVDETRKRPPSVARPAPGPRLPEEAALASRDPENEVGKYVRVSKLGAGGMGEVWKAWDTMLHRWVALKFLKGGEDDEVARFKREAQTAGRLSHPNIAAIHEVGESRGRHWIAMEFVPGQTLKTFPRHDRKELVRLVRDAARALAYAHEEGVTHRDVKPENLMVVTRGKPGADLQVFVMDFGLARQTEGASDLSVSGYIVGTPPYMAPEQTRGETVDPRVDVWSLGATLYELLTDRRPFGGANVVAVLKEVQEVEPKAPRKIDPRIDRDLETVVLKCLEKDKERRYGSAGEMAEDLTGYLEGEAVLAHPPSTAYLLRRWVGRRKALTAAIVAAAIAVVGGGTAILVQRDQAGRREESLRELATLWSAIVEKKRDLRQLKVPVDRAVKQLKGSIAELETHSRKRPEEPQGYYLAARGWMYLGDLDQAEMAIRIAVAKQPEFHPGWSLLGMVKLGQYDEKIYGESGTEALAEARPLLEEGQRAFERGWAEGREREEAQKWGLAWTAEDAVMRRLGRALQARYVRKRTDEAIQLLEEGLGEYRAEEYLVWLALWTSDGDARTRHFADAIAAAPGYWWAYLNRGRTRKDSGDRAGALADYDRAIELRKDFPWAYINRGIVKRELGDPAGAIADYDRAIELKKDFAHAYVNRGRARKDRGDRAGALADYDRAIELRKDFPVAYINRGTVRRDRGDLAGALADYDRAIELKKDFPEAYYNRAGVKWDRGDLAGAMSDYDRAIEFRKDFAAAYDNRGSVKRDRGDLAGALADYDRAIELEKRSPETYYNRGSVRGDRGDPAGAMADYDRAIELKKNFPEAYYNRGVARRHRGDLAGAMADYHRAIELRKDFPEAYNNRGNLRRKQGNLAGALADWTKAIEIDPRTPKALNSLVSELLAAEQEGLRDRTSAKLHALKAAERTGYKHSPILDALALAYYHTGSVREAVETQRKAIALLPKDTSPESLREFEARLKKYEGGPPGER